MKNKIYLSLALLMGTAQLFGAEATLDPKQLFWDNNYEGGIVMPLLSFEEADLVKVTQALYQEHGTEIPTDLLQQIRGSHEKNVKKFGGLVFGKGILGWNESDINRALDTVFNQALLYEDDNNVYHAGSLTDLVTAFRLWDLYTKNPATTYRISNFVENAWRAKEHAGSQSKPRQDVVKLDFLLRNRNKAEDAQLRNALLKIHNPSFPVVGGRYGIDQQLGKALMHAGVFELNSENPQTKELINKIRYTEDLKTNEDAKKIALASLQPDSDVSAPGTSGAGTSTPQPAETPKGVITPQETLKSQPVGSSKTKSQQEVATELFDDISNEKLLLERVKKAVDNKVLTDINIRDNTGETALTLGAMKNYPTFITYVLKIGAKPDVTNSSGNTALYVAEGHHSNEAIAILKPLTGQPTAPSTDTEQPQGHKEHEDTVEAIVKHHTGPALTHQDIRTLWQQLNKGGALTADVAQQLIALASDPEGATNREKNTAWVVSTMLIRANPKALDGLTGISQETIGAWKRIATKR